MSFNVTQCPACESTFNTNSRVLAAAAGKVRCGACLNVFEAIDNFLIPEEDDAEHEQGESVFVGNNPQEYFDPSSFLTRSALRETQHSDSVAIDPDLEKELHDELEQSETLNEEFFTTVAEELKGSSTQAHAENAPAESERERLEQHSPQEETEQREPEQAWSEHANSPEESEQTPRDYDEKPHETEPEHGQSEPEPERKLLEYLSIHNNDEALEDEILSAFDETTREDSTKAAEPDSIDQAEEAASTTEAEAAPVAFMEPLENSDEPFGDARAAEPSPEAGESQQEPTETSVGLPLSASFTFGYLTSPQSSPPESEPADQEEEVIEPPLEADDASEAEEEFHEEIEEQFQSANGEELAQDSSDEPPIPDAVDELHFSIAEIEPEEPPVGEPAEYASGLTSDPDAESEAHLAFQEALDNSQELLDEEQAEKEPEAELTVAANAEGAHEEVSDSTADQHTEDIDESTEAIRARALEAELEDEEALEAIPQENLAALGTMASPLEFLAGKESRLLRSVLLLLSIVFLGGLLSAQFLWQRMELYSQLPQLRSLYETVCATTGCELPVFRDINAIRSENLTVQTHPSFENGLLVNTVIRNSAAFEQPFPILILSFNSADNTVIALREFSAAEYLEPGLRSVQSMPSMTPVQIGLAIMDPGSEAVNYTLAFR